MMDLDGPRQSPSNDRKPSCLVILLHGYGSDGNDLIGLAPIMGRDLPDVEFVSPHAPFPCEMSPAGRQWFSLGDRSADSMIAGVTMASQILNAFIDDELKKNNLSSDKLALVGFSQGTMLSLFLGPRRASAIAGIVGYSGRLIAPELLGQDIKTRPPVTLIHGASDEMVPASSLDDAVKGLSAVGIKTESEMRPGLGHSIDQQGLSIGAAFLKRVLNG